MSTTKPGSRAPTLADLDALPPGIVGEIINGVPYTMTKPRARHQRTMTGIGSSVGEPFDMGRGGPGGWWIVTGPGIELPTRPRSHRTSPAGGAKRMPEMPGDEPIRLVPDCVCEILSKHTRRHDQHVKMPYYAEVGVPYSRIVDLEARVLTAQRLESTTGSRSARTATRPRRGSRRSTPSP